MMVREVISRHCQTVTLRAGQAVLVDNHRVLHGRTGFSGKRLLLRALGDARSHLRLGDGFALLGQPADTSTAAGVEHVTP
jgi:hypothetical protein